MQQTSMDFGTKHMLLDLKNNELIFSMVDDLKVFRADLQAVKGLKYREYKNKFYIPLTHFDGVRQVIGSKYRGRISLTIAYQKFANLFVLDKNPVKIRWTPATCHITGSGIPWEDIIPATSYFDKKAKNSQSYGKTWSGYTHLFDAMNGSFPSGLIERIVQALVKHNVPYTVERTFNYPAPYIKLNPVFGFTPTEDQIAAVAALSKANHGIGKLPTGFGKTSYVAAALIAEKGVRALFLANQRVLTDDAKRDFDGIFAGDNIKIGMIGDGTFDPGDITVCSIQSIAAALKPPTHKERQLAQHELDLAEQRLKYAEDEEHKSICLHDVKRYRKRLASIDARMDRHDSIIPFLKSIDLFIVDEAQVLGTDQWNFFLHACPAPYRYTLSATPTRTDGGGIQIIAATGEPRYTSSAAEQIAKGRLAEFMGHFVKFDHKMDRDVTKDLAMDYHQAYELFIVNNPKRNEHLCRKVVEWARDSSVLALVTRKEHGEIVKRMLVEMGFGENDAHYIDGDTPKKLRQGTIEAFRNSEFPVLIGTSIFDVGFNAKNASKIVRFNAGGSEVREPQRAGRTVRLRDDGSIGESYDIIDTNCPFFETQGWKRVKFLREEFGKDRVRIHPKVIDGDLNVVALEEIVSAIPNETDRLKGEEIIKTLQFGTKNLDGLPDYNTDELEPDLQSLLAQLTFPE